MDKFNKILLPVSTLTILGCAEAKDNKPKDDRPNIIYVYPDQFRNQALAFWNEEGYAEHVGWKADPVKTPRLDEFADEAVVFSRAMSNCPLSSPYRGIFLTGMYPERNGITLNCMAERPESSLREDAICISDVLSEQGYSCGYIGKLHADHPTPNDPANPGQYVSDRRPEWDAYTPAERRHGFSYWYSYGTFDEHKNPHYWDTDGVRHDPKVWSVGHETDKAIEFLRNENGEREEGAPFFLTIAYNPPHSPYESLDDCMAEDYALYEDMGYPELYVRENADTTLSKAPAARYYFANVTGVDREFGRLLDALEELGLDDNTIVVFTSDHGETMCSQGTEDPKNSIYTESFNVPFMIRYPEKIRPRVDSTLFSSVDIMPTLLSMAGLKDEIPSTVEGRDISPVILENGEECNIPESALYIRNLNGPKGEDGMVKGFFPVARGIKTSRYTFEISIKRDKTLDNVTIFDDLEDPYQLSPINYREAPELFASLLEQLESKLEEANDVWHREKMIEHLKF